MENKNLNEEKKDILEMSEMFSKLKEPLKNRTQGIISGMVLAQEALEKTQK